MHLSKFCEYDIDNGHLYTDEETQSKPLGQLSMDEETNVKMHECGSTVSTRICLHTEIHMRTQPNNPIKRL